MKSISKYHTTFFMIMLLFLFSACTSSKLVEVVAELPTENSSTATATINANSIPANTPIPVDTLTPKPANTNEPTSTITPSPTNTSEPTIIPTVEPTPYLPPESPFTFTEERLVEQIGERSQFPIQPNSIDIYGVTVVQEKSILVTDNVEIDGPFGYIIPGIIGIGWMKIPDGSPIRVAFISSGIIHKGVTFISEGYINTEESGMYSLGHYWRGVPDMRTRTERTQLQLLTEQKYYIRRVKDIDIVTAIPIMEIS